MTSFIIKQVEPDEWLRSIKKQLKHPSNKVSVEDLLQQNSATEVDADKPRQKLVPTSPRSLKACLHLVRRR